MAAIYCRGKAASPDGLVLISDLWIWENGMPEGKASRGRGLYLLRLVASVLLLGWQILCSSRALYSASRRIFCSSWALFSAFCRSRSQSWRFNSSCSIVRAFEAILKLSWFKVTVRFCINRHVRSIGDIDTKGLLQLTKLLMVVPTFHAIGPYHPWIFQPLRGLLSVSTSNRIREFICAKIFLARGIHFSQSLRELASGQWV